MRRFIKFTEEQILVIINMYTKNNMSMNEIGKIYGVDGHKIKQILLENNVEVDSRGKRKNKYIIDEENNIAKIELRRRNQDSLWALIDLDDLDRVINFPYTWYARQSTSNKKWYVMASIHEKHTTIQLQMFIMNLDGGHEEVADHINHNQLDNRKSNLRVTSNSQNLRNRKGKNITNTTGYRNVAYIKSYKKKPYAVQLMIDGKNKVLGRFSDVDEAGAYAKEMREKYYGKYQGNG